MKNTYILLIIFILSFISCGKKTISEKSFDIVKTDIMYGGMIVSSHPFQIEGENGSRYLREKGGVGGINLSNPELDKLYKADYVITDSTKATLIIQYPLKKIIGYYIFDENGFSKKDLVLELNKAYSDIYSEKEKYGICCDEFSDLELKGINVYKVGQEIYLESEVSSKK